MRFPMFDDTTDTVSLLWAESKDRLRNFISRRVTNDADADDILQDVFVKILRNIDKLKEPDRLYPWIFRTTRNAIADHYRDTKIDLTILDDQAESFAFEPDDASAQEDVLSWLEPMIGELPEKYRDAVMLADIKGLTQNELAEKLEISLSGAKSRVQRGREKLKDKLIQCCRLEFGRSAKIVEYRQQIEECAVCPH
ncbi:MAG TPA: RNA polymerase sigma factor SigZ [Pyrinomonadaceae bacterium]|nr:RNA polymerase sigma factor SigZ [Pyrinomonadaceae bacterium]